MIQQLFKIACFAVAIFVFAGSSSAYAACSNPAGDESDQVYNSSHQIMQFCNGTDWVAMAADGDVTKALSCTDGQLVMWDAAMNAWECINPMGEDTIADLSCADGQMGSWNDSGTAWVCADSIAFDNFGNHLATTDIDVATNGIVNAGHFTFTGTVGDGPVSLTGATLTGGLNADCGVVSLGTLADVVGSPSTVTDHPSILLVSTVGCSAVVGVAGVGSPEYQICSNSDCSTVVTTWSSDAGSVENGQYVQVRATAPLAGSGEMVYLGIAAEVREYELSALPPYKRVFATSTLTRGNFGGVAGADAMCAADATTYGLSGTYLAWVATSAANDPDSRFTKATGDYRNAYDLDEIVANGWSDLVDSSIDTSIRSISDGSVATYVWTGIQQNGSLIDTRCSEWTSTGGNGRNGRPGTIGSKSWTNHNNDVGCNNFATIYCFEQ